MIWHYFLYYNLIVCCIWIRKICFVPQNFSWLLWQQSKMAAKQPYKHVFKILITRKPIKINIKFLNITKKQHVIKICMKGNFNILIVWFFGNFFLHNNKKCTHFYRNSKKNLHKTHNFYLIKKSLHAIEDIHLLSLLAKNKDNIIISFYVLGFFVTKTTQKQIIEKNPKNEKKLDYLVKY